MIKYNEKYDRWFSDTGEVYSINKKTSKFEKCKTHLDLKGYVCYGLYIRKGLVKQILVHRAVYETFVGEIPANMQIDHLNTNKQDNSVSNLKLCSPKENSNNPLTIEHIRTANQIIAMKPRTIFGKKFQEHFSIQPTENMRLYDRERRFFSKYKKCSWEV